MHQTEFKLKFDQFVKFVEIQANYQEAFYCSIQQAMDFSTYLKLRAQEIVDLCKEYDPDFKYTTSNLCDKDGNCIQV